MNNGNKRSFLWSISTEDNKPLLYIRINDIPGAIEVKTTNRNSICVLSPSGKSNNEVLLMLASCDGIYKVNSNPYMGIKRGRKIQETVLESSCIIVPYAFLQQVC